MVKTAADDIQFPTNVSSIENAAAACEFRDEIDYRSHTVKQSNAETKVYGSWLLSVGRISLDRVKTAAHGYNLCRSLILQLRLQ